MNILPQTLDKEEFIAYLKKNVVSEKIIKRVMNLPEKIIVNDVKYYLYTTTTQYNVGTTRHEFELNYYSDEMVRFLLSIESYPDIEISLNHIECDLKNLNINMECNK